METPPNLEMDTRQNRGWATGFSSTGPATLIGSTVFLRFFFWYHAAAAASQ
jgi:hypothetical protein